MAMTAAERRKKVLASKKSTSNLKAKTAYQKTQTENRRSKPAAKKYKKAKDMPTGWANPKKPKPKPKPKPSTRGQGANPRGSGSTRRSTGGQMSRNRK